MTTEQEFIERDPTMEEYDPARRRRRGGRRWAFDPARRRHRTGGRRRRRISFHPRRHRTRGYDPARRRRFGGLRRRFGRRRYDPAFGSAGGWMDIGTDYVGVAAGSTLHNFITSNKGYLSNVRRFGPFSITDLGAIAGVGGILAEHMGFIKQNGLISQVLKGIFGEGFNVPPVENVTRTGPGGAGGMFAAPGTVSGYEQNPTLAGQAATPMSSQAGPYYMPPWYTM